MTGDINKYLILFLFISVLPRESPSQSLKCYYCGEKISGQYIEAEGRYYHPEHFICGKCAKPIKGAFFKSNDRYYDEICFKKYIAGKCGHCGEPLEGEYVTADGKSFHRECYYDNIALRCDLCGEVIAGEYLKDYWGNSYHKRHETESDRCDYCDRFISGDLTDGGFEYADGRIICGICERTSVNTEKEALQILKIAAEKLSIHAIRVDPGNIRLTLVDRDQMRKVSNEKNSGTGKQGFVHYNYLTRNGEIIERKFDVYILSGLPHRHLLSVAAHELMHVWQYLNSREEIDPAFCEGSCNFASYLVLKDAGDKNSQFLIDRLNNNPDPVYGEGFRRVKRLANQLGNQAWLDYLRSRKGFPHGY